jgi:hypothetical protein
MSIRSKIGHCRRKRRCSSVVQIAHDPLDAGPVVPGPVEQPDLPGGRQVLDVPLEVPLRPLPLRRRGQRDDLRDAGVQVLGDPLDRPALARGVAALEDHDEPLPGRADPLLHLDQLLLQVQQLGLVEVLVHLLRLDRPAPRPCPPRRR